MDERLREMGRKGFGRRVPEAVRARPRSGRAGFTLTELVVTLAVLALLTGMAAPSFRDLIAAREQSARYNRLVSDLHLARSEAIKRGGGVRVCARQDTDSCGTAWADGWHVYVDRAGGGAGTIDAGEPILRSHRPKADDGASIAASATVLPAAYGVASSIRFDSRGRADWTLGTFVLCDERGAERALGLIINGAGGLRRASPLDGSGDVVANALGDAVECPP